MKLYPILTPGLGSVQAPSALFQESKITEFLSTPESTKPVQVETPRPRRTSPGSYSRISSCRPEGIWILRKTPDFAWISTGFPSSSARHPGSQVSLTTSRSAAIASTRIRARPWSRTKARAGPSRLGIGPRLALRARRSRHPRPSRHEKIHRPAAGSPRRSHRPPINSRRAIGSPPSS